MSQAGNRQGLRWHRQPIREPLSPPPNLLEVEIILEMERHCGAVASQGCFRLPLWSTFDLQVCTGQAAIRRSFPIGLRIQTLGL